MQVLYNGETGDDNLGAAVGAWPSHRSQPVFEPAVVGLGRDDLTSMQIEYLAERAEMTDDPPAVRCPLCMTPCSGRSLLQQRPAWPHPRVWSVWREIVDSGLAAMCRLATGEGCRVRNFATDFAGNHRADPRRLG
jgi:hypothetical protein